MIPGDIKNENVLYLRHYKINIKIFIEFVF